MRNIDRYLFLIALFSFCLFLIYLLFDYVTIKGKANAFWDKWADKTLWIWLPFYALQRLIREIFFGK